MNDITIYIRYKDSKSDYTCPDTIILGDLLNQLAGRGVLDRGLNYVVVKGDSEEALDQTLSLQENGVQDGDVLDVAAPGKAG